MELFQILSCSNDLGSCCNDFNLVLILDTVRRIMNLIQIIVPIMLIVWSMYEMFLLMQNPDDKKGGKKIINKFIAAAVIFFIPMFLDITIGLTGSIFSISSCWDEAKTVSESIRGQNSDYEEVEDRKLMSIIIDPSKYDKGVSSSKVGSAKGAQIVQYAKSFVGKEYVWGGTWNGEAPYTGTDCSGFVQGVFKHNGINLSRSTYSQWADTGSYTLVDENNIKPGDLIMYDGHVGILTGNGNEIVHAKGSRWGIVIDPDYHNCSSQAILGIMRINGVN